MSAVTVNNPYGCGDEGPPEPLSPAAQWDESNVENLLRIAERLPLAVRDSDFFGGLENALLRINDPIPTSDSEEDEIAENESISYMN